MSISRKQLVLNKGSERYIFRYDEGSEGQLLDAIVEKASDRNSEFDWFDAAVLSFKLTQALICQAEKILHKDIPEPAGGF